MVTLLNINEGEILNSTTTTDDFTPADDLTHRIEHNRLEALRRRQESQQRAASTLEAPIEQQAFKPPPPTDDKRAILPDNVVFHDGGVYVKTFNPVSNPKDTSVGMNVPQIHNPYMTPKVAYLKPKPLNISPASEVNTPPVTNNHSVHRNAMLPILGDELSGQPSVNESASVMPPSSEHSTLKVKRNTIAASIIDLTVETPGSDVLPPKKKSKTISIELMFIVSMPGLADPIVKKVQCNIESPSV